MSFICSYLVHHLDCFYIVFHSVNEDRKIVHYSCSSSCIFLCKKMSHCIVFAEYKYDLVYVVDGWCRSHVQSDIHVVVEWRINAECNRDSTSGCGV